MSPSRRASPAERARPAQVGHRGERPAEQARAREPPPPGRQADRPSGGGLRGRHRGHRGVRLIDVDRHQGCRWRGPRRGRRRGGGDHRQRRGGRARNGGGARRAGHGGAMAAEHDRQRDSHPGSDGYTSKNGDARPEARPLHAGVDRPLQPAQPRLTPSRDSTIPGYRPVRGDVRPRLGRPSVEHGVPAVISRDRPDLDGAVPGRRVLGRHLDGLVEIGAVDHVVPGDLLLGLGERPVADQ